MEMTRRWLLLREFVGREPIVLRPDGERLPLHDLKARS